MTPAQDVASYSWPALTAPRCTTKLHGGVLVCRGDRGHFLCRLLGHRWRVTTPAGISAAPCLECRRCARVGWLV